MPPSGDALVDDEDRTEKDNAKDGQKWKSINNKPWEDVNDWREDPKYACSKKIDEHGTFLCPVFP